MSDLLSAWVLSSSGDQGSELSAALEQSRLSYHAQQVRKISAGDSEVRIKEGRELSSDTVSKRKMKRRPPPSRQSVTDSGVMSGSNSTVTDNGDRLMSEKSFLITKPFFLRKYLDIFGMENSGASSPSERSNNTLSRNSKDDLTSARNSDKVDLFDFENDSSDLDQDPEEYDYNKSKRRSRLPKVVSSPKKDLPINVDKKSSIKLPDISPSKLPRYPNAPKTKRSDSNSSKTQSRVTETTSTSSEIKSRRSPRKERKRNNSRGKSGDKSSDDDAQEEQETRIKRRSSTVSPSKHRKSPSKTSQDKGSRKNGMSVKNISKIDSDDSDDDHNDEENMKTKKMSPKKSRSMSPVKTLKSPVKSKLRKQTREENEDLPEKPSNSPTKTRRESSQSPTKKSRQPSQSPVKQRKTKNKEVESENNVSRRSPTKSRRSNLSRSQSESVSISNKTRKKKNGKLNREDNVEFSDEEFIDDHAISDQEEKSPKKGKTKKKSKDVMFSDEEEESPFGLSKGGGKNYWRRTTYLDILKIEKERRESIKKMKEEKEKEKEQKGGKNEKKEKFIRDSFGNKVFLSSKGKKDAEKDEAPDHIDIAVQDIVSKALIISSNANYGRNRDSLMSMIKRKLKEDHYLRSLCQTDEWFLKNIILAMVSFGPLMKIFTKTQALSWIFLSRLAFFWSKDGKSPPNDKELINGGDYHLFSFYFSFFLRRS